VKFEVYEDTGGNYRWRLLSGSNKVAVSGESFASKSNAERAASGFKASAASCTYNVFGGGDKWYWNAEASNGKKVASGGESFVTQTNAQRAANNVRDNAGGATGP
jgi:uncharacterized protein